MKERLLAAIAPILGLALFAATIAILHRELAAYHLTDVVGHLQAIPVRQLALALLLTGAGYLALTGYDLLAFRWIGRALALRRIALIRAPGLSIASSPTRSARRRPTRNTQ